MELSPYIHDFRVGLLAAAEANGEEARALADRLVAPVEAMSRLVLLEALSAAAAEITSDLAPGSVEVRLRGLDPEFVVTSPPVAARGEPDRGAGATAPSPAPEGDDGSMARTTLRLPEHLKQRVEDAAARDGLSVNAWLVRAVDDALNTRGAGRSSGPATAGQRLTGWAH